MSKRNFRYSDLATTIRILAVSIFALLVADNPTIFGLWPGLALIVLIFATDSIDGFLARNFDKESKYGAFYDIVGDRIAEIVLLIPFTALGVAHPILLIYFVVKGFLIDYRRFMNFNEKQATPFKQSGNKIFQALVASRLMRNIYGVTKLVMILLFYVLIFNQDLTIVNAAGITAITALSVSVLRTLPTFLSK